MFGDDDQPGPRAHHPHDLGRPQTAAAVRNEVEEVVWVGEGGGRRRLEDDPSLGIEPDTGSRNTDLLLRGIDAANPRGGELARQEEHAITLTAANLQDALRGAGGAQHRRRESGERRVGRCLPAIHPEHRREVAERRRADDIGLALMPAQRNPRSAARRAFAAIALAALLAALSGCGGGDGGDTGTTATTSSGCEAVSAPPAKSVSYKAPAPTVKKGEKLTAVVETSCGTFDIALDAERAPKTVNSFVFLSEKGFYDDLDFHRVARGFVIQGGDPQGNGTGGPGYSVDEKPPSNLAYTKGVVAMAKSPAEPPGRSGSQFFVVTGADAGLPPEYALVGKVSAGMDVVARIDSLGTTSEQPREPVLIKKITIERG